jgi:hypothetical protein
MLMVEICCTNTAETYICSVALAYFDFVAGDLNEVLHLENKCTVLFLDKSAARMDPKSLALVCHFMCCF